MTSPKDHNNLPVINPEDMEICHLPNKEFKIVLRKLNEVQENTERQFNKIRKTIHEQNKKFNKEIEIIKTTKQILELKNTMKELKNAIECISIRKVKEKKKIHEIV